MIESSHSVFSISMMEQTKIKWVNSTHYVFKLNESRYRWDESYFLAYCKNIYFLSNLNHGGADWLIKLDNLYYSLLDLDSMSLL